MIIFLYIYIYIYIRVVRRALNLLRASFSPIFQHFSAVNDTRVSFSPIFQYDISNLYAMHARIHQPWKLGAVRSHRDFRVRRSVVHRALNWLVTHNQYYRSNHVHINVNALEQLRHDGNLSQLTAITVENAITEPPSTVFCSHCHSIYDRAGGSASVCSGATIKPIHVMRSEDYSSCFIILSVCLSVCVLPRFQPLRATRRPISDKNGFSATLALFVKMLRWKVMA